ncbi:hypothetical protein C2845_PM12G10110 [Panicum miliaceum]|uniref:F-box protein AT5G49610-like beta-propeller domain-containing protein n=1 Tax=Panicum miliaceum TaxID=4540 RepID=A0A3L6QCJ4_PANMI|nr:hypothetical protein C2845_PM12G10110 [Panicum miliaceum]
MESIVGCWNGRVLVKHRGHYDRNYSVLSPLHSSAATVRAPPVPGAGDDPYDALWGFGQTSAEPSMFDFDCTTGKFIQQVVYVRRQSTSWVTYVSPPLEVPVQLVFNSEPCSLLVGGRWLCMTTVLGCIVVFDLATATFSVVSFPDGVSVSCGVGRRTLNHSLARAGDSGIYLVHAMGVELDVWFRRMDGDAAGIWERGETVDLPVVFGDHVAMEFWDSVRSLNDDVNRFLADYTWACYSVEIHAVGDNAEFAFLTVGKLGGVFLLDVKRTVEKVLEASLQDDGQQCGIFAFMMPWPPVFPALNQRG